MPNQTQKRRKTSKPASEKHERELDEIHSRVWLDGIDQVALIYSLFRAAAHPQIGHGDAERFFKQLLAAIGRPFKKVDWAIVESCLWYANALAEEGAFWHPLGWSFDKWMKERFKLYTYNKELGILKRSWDGREG